MIRNIGLRFRVNATGTSSATATKLAESGKTHYITDVSVSSDLAGAVMTIKDGTTKIWEAVLPANGSYEHTFGTELAGTKGNAVSVTVNGTSVAKANIAGFTI